MLNTKVRNIGLETARGEEGYVERILDFPMEAAEMAQIQGMAKYIGVTKEFKKVIDTFKVPAGETPAGFKVEYELDGQVLRANLKRGYFL